MIIYAWSQKKKIKKHLNERQLQSDNQVDHTVNLVITKLFYKFNYQREW